MAPPGDEHLCSYADTDCEKALVNPLLQAVREISRLSGVCGLPHNSSKASSPRSACHSSFLFSLCITSLLGQVVEVQGESCAYSDHCYTAVVAVCMMSPVISLYHCMLFFSVFTGQQFPLFFSVYLLDNHFLCFQRSNFLSLIEVLRKKIVSSVSHRGFGRIQPEYLTLSLSSKNFISLPLLLDKEKSLACRN